VSSSKTLGLKNGKKYLPLLSSDMRTSSGTQKCCTCSSRLVCLQNEGLVDISCITILSLVKVDAPFDSNFKTQFLKVLRCP
jgi:hypothetical protein